LNWTTPEIKRIHEIPGNEFAKRALEVALSGSHSVVILSTIRSPASDLLRSAARIAKENGFPFKGRVVPLCKCGAFGNTLIECTCSPEECQEYAKEIGLFLKEADLLIETVEPRARETINRNEQESDIVKRIMRVQTMEKKQLYLSRDAEDLLVNAIGSIRVNRDQTLRVAETIARMDHSEDMLKPQHIAEAAQYHRINDWYNGFENIEVK
jgi:magnesium chelatase family protein